MITNEQLVQWHKEFENAKAIHDWIGGWDDYVRWRQHRPMQRKIVIADFNGPGKHLYEDMLGWQYEDKQEVKSSVSRVLFETYVIDWAHNFSFYYVDNDTFYGFHAQGNPIYFKKLERDRSQPCIGWQCEGNPHPRDGEEILGVYEVPEDSDDETAWRTMWDTIKIDGKSLEEVIQRSYIILLSL